jgi:hypothetical protein
MRKFIYQCFIFTDLIKHIQIHLCSWTTLCQPVSLLIRCRLSGNWSPTRRRPVLIRRQLLDRRRDSGQLSSCLRHSLCTKSRPTPANLPPLPVNNIPQ